MLKKMIDIDWVGKEQDQAVLCLNLLEFFLIVI